MRTYTVRDCNKMSPLPLIRLPSAEDVDVPISWRPPRVVRQKHFSCVWQVRVEVAVAAPASQV